MLLKWFAMGGYGPYVWSSYACGAVILLSVLIWSLKRHKRAIQQACREDSV